MEALPSRVSGRGPEVVLIHGGMTDGPLAWFAQEPLAERWTLRLVDRAGYGQSAALSSGEDIELDARALASSLDRPVHLVGHSSGAIVAMLTAAAAPLKVRSMTAIEPPAYRFLDDPEVVKLAEAGSALWGEVDLTDRDWLMKFFVTYGEAPPPQEVVAMLEPHVSTFRRFVRFPWDIALPVQELAAAPFPSLIISGGHDPAFELLNDQIAQAINARRAVVEGAGHEVQMTGPPFNQVLDEFLDSAADAGGQR